jgi:hypothetical protein
MKFSFLLIVSTTPLLYSLTSGRLCLCSHSESERVDDDVNPDMELGEFVSNTF